MLTAVMPLTIDLYLPALPAIRDEWEASDSLAQLTLSACLLGLAIGQLVFGPLSDRVGRVSPLRWGLAALAATSFLCALAPTMETLLLVRAAQGFAGSAAYVITRAIVRDLFDGARAAKVFADLLMIMGVVPILAPAVGSQLLRVTSWRGVFVFLGIVTCIAFLAALLRLPETHRRSTQSIGALGDFRILVRDRQFAPYLIIAGSIGVIMFSYVTMSSFVLQEQFDLSASGYSFIFALNGAGLILGGQTFARMAGRHGVAKMLRAAIALILVATACLAAAVALDAPLAAVLVPLWCVLAGLGGAGGNMTALALTSHGRRAGAGAALLGTVQSICGATVPPIASIAGTSVAVMSLSMVSASAIAWTALVFALRSGRAPNAGA